MDNIITHIPRVYIETKTSQKSGKPYTTINAVFNRPNGKQYTLTNFLTEEQKSLIEDSVPLASASEL